MNTSDVATCSRCGCLVALHGVSRHANWHDLLEEWQTDVNGQLNELAGKVQEFEGLGLW